MAKARKLKPSALRWRCPASWVSTRPGKGPADVVTGLIGQSRALDALQMGIGIRSRGYNIFVSGIAGTHKTSTVRELLQRMQLNCPVLHDHLFVHNFQDPYRPRHLRLPMGGGPALARAMDEWVRSLQRTLPRILTDKGHVEQRKALIGRYRRAESLLFERIGKRAEQSGLVLVQVQSEEGAHPDIFFRFGEEVLAPEQLAALPPEEQPSEERLADLVSMRKELLERLEKAAYEARALALRLVRESQALDEKAATEQVKVVTGQLLEELPEDEELQDWIGEAAVFALDNLSLFSRGAPTPLDESGDEGDEDAELAAAGRSLGLEVFSVHVVRNAESDGRDGCPVRIESHPTYSNLFGVVERPALSAGPGHFHEAVQGGTLLSADGGYLVLNANDVFRETAVWRTLKRVIQSGRLQIHGLESVSPLGLTGVRPQSIPVDIKVILIGEDSLYEALHDSDYDFPKLFKVKAEFDDTVPRDKQHARRLGTFLAEVASSEGLPSLNPSALQLLYEWAVRDAGRRDRLTARVHYLADLVREAAYFAQMSGSKTIGDAQIANAIRGREHQHNLDAEHHTKMILQGILHVDTDGKRVGSLNALTVVAYGPTHFGRPARISAAVGVGDDSVTNIEREVNLSGPIHDKGVLLLESFFLERFGAIRQLPFKASLVFDQSYGPIDGDSASSTEVYALLSALSGLPLRQDIAVTGAVSSHGEILAIGGANEKIEGFFAVCRERGLTGKQGCIIPKSNVDDLMLRNTVIRAVEKGEFHIWATETIGQGIELLTGVSAGRRRKSGTYPPESVFGRVEARLAEFEQIKDGKDKGGDSSSKKSAK